MNYVVYKTTNKVNGKIYVGVHYTNPDIFDGYIGCGMYSDKSQKNIKSGFPAAVRKYGYCNFKREILYVYPDSEEGMNDAYKKEEEIVSYDFVRRKDTYNICIGGKCALYHLRKKTISQYTLDGTFIRTWESIKEAEDTLGLNSIKAAISGKSKYCGGYQWKTYSGDNSNIQPVSTKEKTVYQFDLSGNLIKVWKSASNAASELHFVVQAIINCCNKKTRSSYGFFWSYKKRFEYLPYNKNVSVASYLDDGTFVKSFDSLMNAANEIKVNAGNIISCIQGRQKHCGNFRWRYFYGNTQCISPL